MLKKQEGRNLRQRKWQQKEKEEKEGSEEQPQQQSWKRFIEEK